MDFRPFSPNNSSWLYLHVMQGVDLQYDKIYSNWNTLMFILVVYIQDPVKCLGLL